MKLLPDKYSESGETLVGVAADILATRRSGSTVSDIWTTLSGKRSDVSFDQFCDAMALLFAMGAVNIYGGELEWVAA